jgi:hypothetical protein
MTEFLVKNRELYISLETIPIRDYFLDYFYICNVPLPPPSESLVLWDLWVLQYYVTMF